MAKPHHITVVRVGSDPFGRGETTVFYRDSAIYPNEARFNRDGTVADEVYYLWLCHWPKDWPAAIATAT